MLACSFEFHHESYTSDRIEAYVLSDLSPKLAELEILVNTWSR